MQRGNGSLFLEENRARFEINANVAERCVLKISSKLLTMAKVVTDETCGGNH